MALDLGRAGVGADAGAGASVGAGMGAGVGSGAGARVGASACALNMPALLTKAPRRGRLPEASSL